ncbi:MULTISPECIES: hypothetical protein [Nocardiaceae]|uniref:hypothetical protein n=1 Tax=Nocardiaceae TaxID=85025 RepID=UPI000AEC3120|nr:MULTISPECIES: hypothetical protein [Rhodococcus]
MARQPAIPLVAKKAALLNSADRSQIVKALSRTSLTADSTWLPATNPFQGTASPQLKTAIATAKSLSSKKLDTLGLVVTHQVPETQFADLLAASTFVHCGDGWSYLGHGINALLRGDEHSAIHFIYYAELRAAFSLLCSEGIYIGDGVNAIVNRSSEVLVIDQDTTHQAAWKFLDSWSQSKRAQDLLGEILKPANTNLKNWVASAGISGIQPAISDLLRDLSFDLATFAEDRERRNSATYLPTRLHNDDGPPLRIAKMVANFWRSLEPDVLGGFPTLDGALLRQVLVKSYGGLNKDSVTDAIDWANWETWLASVAPGNVTASALYKDLVSEPTRSGTNAGPFDTIFSTNPTKPTITDQAEQMLLRATMLLRLATGSASRLVEESGISKTKIHPWIKSLGEIRGLWPSSDPPEDSLDLWADSELAAEIADDLKTVDRYSMLKELGEMTVTLSQPERVVAWSF